MISIVEFISDFLFPASYVEKKQPWEITTSIKSSIEKLLLTLGKDYHITEGIAIHKTAIIEAGAILKAPVIVMEHSTISSNAYLREGAVIGKNTKIGPGCEIKASIIGKNSAIAHFNYIGNSIIGENVNFEAGAIAANHYNERTEKEITVIYKNEFIKTKAIKFGSLVGDNSKIGANAVLSPGTILPKNTVIKRLELVEQVQI